MKKTALHQLCLLLATAILLLALGGCSIFDGLGKAVFGDGEEESEESDPDSEPAVTEPEYPFSANGASLKTRPGRVISLSPSITEKLFDMNLDDRVVGVSDFCDYPRNKTIDLPKCGTPLLPEIDVIESLTPHLVLTESVLSEEDLIALQQLNIEVAVIPRAKNLNQLWENYETIAKLMDGETTGKSLGKAFTDKFKAQLDALSAKVAPYKKDGGIPVLYLRMADFTVATGDTLESELMGTIGLKNIAAKHQDWSFPEDDAGSDEGRAAFYSLETLFLVKETVTITDLEESDFYKALPAVLNDQYMYINEPQIFERQSLRMLDLLTLMAHHCYPDADLDVPEQEDRPDVDEDDDEEEEKEEEQAPETSESSTEETAPAPSTETPQPPAQTQPAETPPAASSQEDLDDDMVYPGDEDEPVDYDDDDYYVDDDDDIYDDGGGDSGSGDGDSLNLAGLR